MRHALASGILATALLGMPSLIATQPESIRIPIVRAHTGDDPEHAALFSHFAHSAYGCFRCHPGLFPETRTGFTHDDMDKGLYCGACHNDQITWSPDDPDSDCEDCHVKP